MLKNFWNYHGFKKIHYTIYIHWRKYYDIQVKRRHVQVSTGKKWTLSFSIKTAYLLAKSSPLPISAYSEVSCKSPLASVALVQTCVIFHLNSCTDPLTSFRASGLCPHLVWSFHQNSIKHNSDHHVPAQKYPFDVSLLTLAKLLNYLIRNLRLFMTCLGRFAFSYSTSVHSII